MESSQFEMKPFKLERLPAVMLRRVLELMDKHTNMLLSNCSAKTAKWVRAATVKPPVMSISLRMSGNRKTLIFSSDKSNEGYRFVDKKKASDEKYPDAKGLLAEHVNQKVREGDLKNACDMCTYMTSLVVNSYNSRLANWDVDLRTIDISVTLSKIKVSTCENLKLWGVNSTTRPKLLLLLDTIQVTGTLTFLSSPGAHFSYQKPFRMPHLIVKFAKWFSRANLLMSNCETVQLTHSKLECTDLETFVCQWKQGQYRRLKRLEIRQHQEIHVECVVKGLEAKSIGKDRIKEYDEKIAENSPTGFEVQRRNGQTAAVLLEKSEIVWNFYFLVL